MFRSERLAAIALVAGSLLGAGTLARDASAEIRSATVIDPVDAPPTISGIANVPDIAALHIDYDTAGSLSYTVTFYSPLGAIDWSENYAAVGYLRVGPDYPYEYKGKVVEHWCGQALAGEQTIYHSYGSPPSQATIEGYGGKLNFTRSVNKDETQLTYTASSGALAGKDWRCFAYNVNVRSHSSASYIYSHYDGYCGCWYSSGPSDVLGPADAAGNAAGTLWFDGFAPAPPPPEPARAVLKLKVFAKCHAVGLDGWRIAPRQIEGTRRPALGVISARIDGKRQHRFTTKYGHSISWRVQAGRHRISAVYLGDEWRTRSRPVVVRVFSRGC